MIVTVILIGIVSLRIKVACQASLIVPQLLQLKLQFLHIAAAFVPEGSKGFVAQQKVCGSGADRQKQHDEQPQRNADVVWLVWYAAVGAVFSAAAGGVGHVIHFLLHTNISCIIAR